MNEVCKMGNIKLMVFLINILNTIEHATQNEMMLLVDGSNVVDEHIKFHNFQKQKNNGKSKRKKNDKITRHIQIYEAMID